MEAQNQSEEVKKLLLQASEWFKKIEKYEVQELMAFSKLPVAVAFVLKVFYAMVTDQALDLNKDFVKVVNPSEPVQFDSRKVSGKVQQLFSGAFQPKTIHEIIAEFDPLKLSENTVKYLKRIQIETLGGPNPLLLEQNIPKVSYLANKLWNWCKCMLEIRKKLLVDED